jgi:phosphonate transport system ATP-binding protein
LASSPASPPALTLAGVGKRYSARIALRDVSLTVAPGEALALMGPSGAGKTTALLLAAGALAPDAGTVRVAGADPARLGPGRELSRRVGLLAQGLDLVPTLSALQNVLAGNLGRWSLARSLLSLLVPQSRPAAESALARVGLAGRGRERTSRLSGGERQRVAIARLLVQEPALLLADEPVASLDSARGNDVLALLTGIARERGRALVASLHDLGAARAHFDRLVGLRAGRVAFDLPASKVTHAQLSALYALEEPGA